ncbi:hypothetical protein B0T26DRAFT_137333 [Lasiosphaeria miniovina]|uniref:Uncharacterized protein n=1 Tax=Lasiosphaeria miniovina TaxID=1954250 RepID=A0AA40B4C7_9PEZI|nr:uncharacterized protein B0T26DRAFT_137333 [Lasiosphaeria miniovina]KAK0727468.1 hypothetical protein B0T26DRAFT_137333 [Lasiosphaeria miniovina]
MRRYMAGSKKRKYSMCGRERARAVVLNFSFFLSFFTASFLHSLSLCRPTGTSCRCLGKVGTDEKWLGCGTCRNISLFFSLICFVFLPS